MKSAWDCTPKLCDTVSGPWLSVWVTWRVLIEANPGRGEEGATWTGTVQGEYCKKYVSDPKLETSKRVQCHCIVHAAKVWFFVLPCVFAFFQSFLMWFEAVGRDFAPLTLLSPTSIHFLRACSSCVFVYTSPCELDPATGDSVQLGQSIPFAWPTLYIASKWWRTMHPVLFPCITYIC